MGNVRGNEAVGGFAGWQYNSSIANSYSTGSVSSYGTSGAGGFVGNNTYSSITDSYSRGNITMEYVFTLNSSNIHFGGFVGSAFLESAGQIERCYSTARIAGMTDSEANIGGFAGGLNSNNTISNLFWDNEKCRSCY